MGRSTRLALAVSVFAASFLSFVEIASAIDARRVAGGLDAPVAFTFDPSGHIWYVEKNSGRVRILDPATGGDTLFVEVPGVEGSGERGMLGIALHPRYPNRPWVYVYATRNANGRLRNQILRYVDRNGSGRNRTTIWSSPASSSPYHNGGRIAFGPDGKLYAIVGDGHSSARSQDRRDDRGKILRLDADGSVPRNNPFRNRVWAYGIRNSFGFGFDPRTGRLWQTENGPECNDEVNLIRRGRNYGWGPNATCSGTSPRNTNRDGPRPMLPKLYYRTPIAITGLAFCDRCGLGARSDGVAFHAAANDGRITRLTLDSERTGIRREAVVYDHPDAALSVEVGPDRRVYFSDFSGIYVLTR